ncbi:MAG: hypothetical protein ACREJ2_04000, partial [Planctomycetota bacterium]
MLEIARDTSPPLPRSSGAGRRLTGVMAVAAALMWAAFPAAAATPAQRTLPVARLIANLEAYIKEHPTDAGAYNRLARVHVAVVLDHAASVQVETYSGEQMGVAERQDNQEATELLNHLYAAIRNFARAIELDPKDPLFQLNYGYFLEHAPDHTDCPAPLIADSAPTPAEEQKWAPLVRQLDSPAATDREAAQAQLKAAGADAFAVLREHRNDSNLQIRSLVLELLAGAPPLAAETAVATPAQKEKWDPLVRKLDSPAAADRDAAMAQLRAGGIDAVPVLLANLNTSSVQTHASVQELLHAIHKLAWQQQALDHYWQAYQFSFDTALQSMQKNGFQMVDLNAEAEVDYRALVKQIGLTDERRKNLATIDAGDKKLLQARAAARAENLPFLVPPGFSPVVFSLTAAQPLHALVDPAKSVHFDLDGDGYAERRMWVQPDTAILCWDPGCTGKITSGRQLFGNVSWWIFWDNGYQALDALDDNRDGVLTGNELTGLCVWRDANQNGVSDPGEVVPVVNLGIDSIAVRAPQTEDGCPANKLGIHFEDGRTLPTYD